MVDRGDRLAVVLVAPAALPAAAADRPGTEPEARDLVARRAKGLARKRQLLVFDRFLARVVAIFGDAALLKGGLVLELRLERARTTKDIDLRVIGSPDVTWLSGPFAVTSGLNFVQCNPPSIDLWTYCEPW